MLYEVITIKMDRSLVLKYEDGDFSALPCALLLAKNLRSKTVTEGIETEHQLNLMKKLGFDGLGHYAEQRLGMCRSTACERAAAARQAPALSYNFV